jgi:hypothetical protein
VTNGNILQIQQRLEGLSREVETLRQGLTVDEQAYRVKLAAALRETLAQEIEEAKADVMKGVEEGRREIAYLERVEVKTKVWVRTERYYDPQYGEGFIQSTEWAETKPENTPNRWYMSPEEFLRKMEDLKAAVLRGKYDRHLKVKAEKLIHEFLAQGVAKHT